MTITTRAGKGSELTHGEVDTNFIDLRDGVNAQLPKVKGGGGIKVGDDGSATYPWQDLVPPIQVYGEVGDATRATLVGGLKALQFAESDSAYLDFFVPHDHANNTDIYINVHWSHNGTLVTGGSVTWAAEFTYSKAHNQGAFPASSTISVVSPASTISLQHMTAEVLGSSPGGSATTVPTEDLEPGVISIARIYLDSNDMTVSGGGVPDPFLHGVTLHYQSATVGTKNKSPDFWA